MYHQNYLSGEREDLNRFIACFYTDERGFNEKLIFDHTQIIRTNYISTRVAIAKNYEFIREELEKTYPNLFAAAKEIQQIKNTRCGFIHMLDLFADYNIIEKGRFMKTPVIRAFSDLNSIIKECHTNPSSVGLTLKAYSNRNYN
jgi:hypothetical protein